MKKISRNIVRTAFESAKQAPFAKLAAVGVGLAVATVRSQAALSTNITNIVDDLETFFTSISGLITTVVVFGLAIGYAKMLRRK